MKYIWNETGDWCFRNGLCQHNLSDAPMIKRNVCSGLGGICNKGDKHSLPCYIGNFCVRIDNSLPDNVFQIDSGIDRIEVRLAGVKIL
jgi:hypothetical protein